jgi:hypothetical protein
MWKNSVFRRTACLVRTARAFSSLVLEYDTGRGAVIDVWQEVSEHRLQGYVAFKYDRVARSLPAA